MWQAGRLLTRGRKNVRWSCSWWRESTSWYATASFGLLPFSLSWVTLRLACDRSIRAGTSITFPCHHHGAQQAAREGRRWRRRRALSRSSKDAAEEAFLSMAFCVSGDVFLGAVPLYRGDEVLLYQVLSRRCIKHPGTANFWPIRRRNRPRWRWLCRAVSGAKACPGVRSVIYLPG